ncbi:MAG: hypothetical protein RL670_91 [Actinomycetota bacterium]
MLPTLALVAVVFLYNALVSHFTQQWHWYLAWGLGGAITFLFWLVPVIRYAASWVEITTSQVIWHPGIFAAKTAISLHEVQSVESLRAGGIRVQGSNGQAIELRGFARGKLLAQAISEGIRG